MLTWLSLDGHSSFGNFLNLTRPYTESLSHNSSSQHLVSDLRSFYTLPRSLSFFALSVNMVIISPPASPTPSLSPSPDDQVLLLGRAFLTTNNLDYNSYWISSDDPTSIGELTTAIGDSDIIEFFRTYVHVAPTATAPSLSSADSDARDAFLFGRLFIDVLSVAGYKLELQVVETPFVASPPPKKSVSPAPETPVEARSLRERNLTKDLAIAHTAIIDLTAAHTSAVAAKNAAHSTLGANAFSKPDKFTGKSDVHDFFAVMSRFLSGSGYPVDSWALIAGSFLAGEALTHWNSLVSSFDHEQLSALSWDTFKDQLLSLYGSEDRSGAARAELRHLTQTSTCANYARIFRSTLARITFQPPSLGDSIAAFKAGLKFSLRQRCSRDPSAKPWLDLNSLISFAVDSDVAMSSTDQMASALTGVASHGVKRALEAEKSAGFTRVQSRRDKRGAGPSGGVQTSRSEVVRHKGWAFGLSEPDFKARVAGRKCLYCNANHMFADCPDFSAKDPFKTSKAGNKPNKVLSKPNVKGLP